MLVSLDGPVVHWGQSTPQKLHRAPSALAMEIEFKPKGHMMREEDRPPPEGRTQTIVAYGLFAAVIAGISALLVWQVFPEVLEGRLVEADNYMRLVRVQHLMETGSWYDPNIPRSNAPFGEVLHWTRPLDVLLVITRTMSSPFLTLQRSLHFSAIVVPPLLLLSVCYALAWAVLPLSGSRVRIYALIAVLAQLGIVGYGLPGRPDHHVLHVLSFVLVVGSTIRWLGPLHSRAQAVAAGVATAVGVWIGPEFLLIWLLVLVPGVVLWTLRGEPYGVLNLRFSTGLFGGLLIALAAEHPLSTWLIPEFDRVSAPHVLAGGLALVFWCLATGSRLRIPWIGVRAGRLAVAGLGGAAAFVIMLAVYPDFFRGPTVTVDPRLWQIWFNLLEERSSLLPPDGVTGVGNILTHLGAVIFCFPFAAWSLARNRKGPLLGPWLFITLLLVVLTGLALYRIRFVAYPEVILAMVTVVLLSRVLERLDSVQSDLKRALLRSTIAAGLITGFLFLGFGLTAAGGRTAGNIRAEARNAGRSCPASAVITWLANPDGFGDSPRTIAANLDYGPEIMFRTPHSVLGTPYHRNVEGIMAVFAVLANPDLSVSRSTVEDRGVDLILVCPLHSWIYGGTAESGESAPTLHDRLVVGDSPEWLLSVPLPPEVSGDMRLFEVK